jgi:AsmA family protein
LFGPVGIAASLLGGQLGDDNPCLAAIEAAESGVGSPETNQKGKEKVSEGSGEGAGEVIEDIGKSIKKLFGD